MYRKYYSLQCVVNLERNGIKLKNSLDNSKTKFLQFRVYHINDKPVWNKDNPPFIEIY